MQNLQTCAETIKTVLLSSLVSWVHTCSLHTFTLVTPPTTSSTQSTQELQEPEETVCRVHCPCVHVYVTCLCVFSVFLHLDNGHHRIQRCICPIHCYYTGTAGTWGECVHGRFCMACSSLSGLKSHVHPLPCLVSMICFVPCGVLGLYQCFCAPPDYGCHRTPKCVSDSHFSQPDTAQIPVSLFPTCSLREVSSHPLKLAVGALQSAN